MATTVNIRELYSPYQLAQEWVYEMYDTSYAAVEFDLCQCQPVPEDLLWSIFWWFS